MREEKRAKEDEMIGCHHDSVDNEFEEIGR